MNNEMRSDELIDYKPWQPPVDDPDNFWGGLDVPAVVVIEPATEMIQPSLKPGPNKMSRQTSLSVRLSGAALACLIVASPIAAEASTDTTTQKSAISAPGPVLNGLLPASESNPTGVAPEIIHQLVIPKSLSFVRAAPLSNARPERTTLSSLPETASASVPPTIPKQPETASAPVDAKSKASEVLSTYTVSPEGLDLILRSEGWRPEIYNDDANHATIGYGHKIHDGPKNGTEPAEFLNSITQERGKELFHEDLSRFEAGVRELVKVPITQGQFDALSSFGYNMGLGGLEGSTVLKAVNAGNLNDVPEQLRRYVYANGIVLPGLVARREAEIALWNKGNTETSISATAAKTEPQLSVDIAALVSRLTIPTRLTTGQSNSSEPVKATDATPRELKKPQVTTTSSIKPSPRESARDSSKIVDDVLALSPAELFNLFDGPTRWKDSPKTNPEANVESNKLIDASTKRLESNGVTTVEVRGIRIRTEAALKLANLLVAAEKDGFYLTAGPSGAYRSPEQQLAMRAENGCPDVLESAASECATPTAKPGTSTHEASPKDPNEYAVDFEVRGRPIISVADPASVWLDMNGPKYGFQPLKDSAAKRQEPWHRSGTGR